MRQQGFLLCRQLATLRRLLQYRGACKPASASMMAPKARTPSKPAPASSSTSRGSIIGCIAPFSSSYTSLYT
ncbi:hypothetical protein [Xanthomonas phage vB_XooS_NR08]|nr:hypothetical protein [Xanthomonas phage vB_XooS_NR08]